MIGRLRTQVERLTGPLHVRRDQLTRPWRANDTSGALGHLDAMAPVPAASDAPVFIFSATWRSGSTLLQRLVVSSGDAVIWGEPWNRCDLVGSMRRSLTPIDGKWPADRAVFYDGDDDLSGRWIANLFPSSGDLVEAHRAMFRRLLAEPAGGKRWGAKFVRCGLDDARYLRYLFPASKMVFLVRDPTAAWASYRAVGLRAYHRWPDDPVVTATDFGRAWSERVADFLEHGDDVGAMFLRYEDLHDGSTVDRLERHLDVEVDRSVLDDVIGSTGHDAIDPFDVRRLRRTTDEVAARIGYGADRP